MKKILEYKYTKPITFILLSLIYYIFIDFFNRYLILRTFNIKKYLSQEAVLFNIVWIALIILILYMTKGVVRKFVIIIINSLIFIFSIVNYFINSYFGSVFSWKDLLLSGDGFEFISSIFKYINFKLIIFIILCIFINIIILKLSKYNCFKLKSPQTIIVVLVIIILPFIYYYSSNRLSNINDGWDANAALNSKGNYYSAWINPPTLITIGGTYDYIIRDFYESYIKKDNISNSYKIVESYIESHEVEDTNEYTGIFENKNLIFVMMESMDDWMVNEQVTPTIWYMMHHGFNFNNHYSPVYVTGSTANTEFIANTGIYPNINKLSPNYAYKNNSYSYSLANLFKNSGYTVNSFHRSFGHVYNRVQMHSSFGYEKYYNYVDMGISDDNLDLDSYIAIDAYDKIVNDDKFMSFIITYSPHSPYQYSKIECKKNLEYIEKFYSNLDEEMYCAYSSARETDEMFRILLEKLDSDNKLDDTIIIAFTDHPNNVYLSETETDKLNKTIFFIYDKEMGDNQMEFVSSTINILPTVKNLFNLKGEFTYPGCDLFNCVENSVVFNDYTYYDGKIIKSITDDLLQDIKYSKSLLVSDYYKNQK